MTETDWTQLGRTPHTGRAAEDGRRSAREAAATRKRERLGEARLHENFEALAQAANA